MRERKRKRMGQNKGMGQQGMQRQGKECIEMAENEKKGTMRPMKATMSVKAPVAKKKR